MKNKTVFVCEWCMI